MTTIKVGAGPFMKSSLKNLDLDKFSIIRYYCSCSSTPQSAIPAGILISLIWPEAGIRVVLPQFETESITIFGRDGKNMCWIQFFTWPDQPSPSGSLKLPVFTWLLQRQGFPVWDFGEVALAIRQLTYSCKWTNSQKPNRDKKYEPRTVHSQLARMCACVTQWLHWLPTSS